MLANFSYLSFNRSFLKEIQTEIQSNINLADRIRYTNNVIDYYSNIKLLDGNFYSYQAQLHLAQVKNLLNATKIIIGLNIILILSLITILVHEKRYEMIFTSTFYSGLICLALFIFLGVGVTKYFDVMFLTMHKLFFTGTSWLFLSSDTLIQVFPNEFFVLFAKQFAVNTIISSSCLVILSLIAKFLIHTRNS